MIGLQINLLNQYIISPQTWIHSIPYYNKILFFSTYLLLIPYTSIYSMIYSIILYIIIISILQIPKNYIINLREILFIFLIFLFNNYNYTVNAYYQEEDYICIHLTNIWPILYLNVSCFHQINQYICRIPIYIFRGLLIYYTYLGFLKILNFTTNYKNIIKFYTLDIFYNNFNSFWGHQILITVLASQFLVLLTNKIDKILKSIKLRNINNKILYYYALKHLFNNVIEDIQIISKALWSREVVDDNKSAIVL